MKIEFDYNGRTLRQACEANRPNTDLLLKAEPLGISVDLPQFKPFDIRDDFVAK